jgi:methionyl aminopeptidase
MDIQTLRELGKKAREIKEMLPSLVIVGATYLDVAETIEEEIKNAGFQPAFPVNISVNEIAAHYTPTANDTSEFKEGDLVKVDFGLHLEGNIVDTAVTIDLGNHKELVETAELCLKRAIETVKPGVEVTEVSKTIEETAKERGLKPIANLTGHKIEEYLLHAGVSVPNVAVKTPYRFKEGDVFAFEPFVTTQDAKGVVVDTDQVEIYSLISLKKPRTRVGVKLVEYIAENYYLLPFAERWLENAGFRGFSLRVALKELLRMHVLRAYPVLKEASSKPVAQAEHTILVTEKGAEIIT